MMGDAGAVIPVSDVMQIFPLSAEASAIMPKIANITTCSGG